VVAEELVGVLAHGELDELHLHAGLEREGEQAEGGLAAGVVAVEEAFEPRVEPVEQV
jgi:hypothetical protein